jgi:hypothetical protein
MRRTERRRQRVCLAKEKVDGKYRASDGQVIKLHRQSIWSEVRKACCTQLCGHFVLEGERWIFGTGSWNCFGLPKGQSDTEPVEGAGSQVSMGENRGCRGC